MSARVRATVVGGLREIAADAEGSEERDAYRALADEIERGPVVVQTAVRVEGVEAVGPVAVPGYAPESPAQDVNASWALADAYGDEIVVYRLSGVFGIGTQRKGEDHSFSVNLDEDGLERLIGHLTRARIRLAIDGGES